MKIMEIKCVCVCIFLNAHTIVILCYSFWSIKKMEIIEYPEHNLLLLTGDKSTAVCPYMKL